MIKCARCGLLNPDDAALCECGFDLKHGDAASVRGVLKRRGRFYVAGGAVLVVVGLLGGMSMFPFHLSFFFSIGSYRIDLVFVIGGVLLIARGFKILDRPWTEKGE